MLQSPTSRRCTSIATEQSSCSASGLTQDEAGYIYVGRNCDDFFGSGGPSRIERHSADGTDSVQLIEFDGGVIGPIFDAEHNELIFAVYGVGVGASGPSGCGDSNIVYYRLEL